MTEPYSTDSHFQNIMKEIQLLSKKEALDRIIVNLRRMIENGELPVFLDEGGIIEIDGEISEPIQLIIQNIPLNNEIYLAIVSSRRPVNTSKFVARIRINPLKIEDQRTLIRTLDMKYSRRGEKRDLLTSKEVSELAEYTAGYPPSAYAALELVEEYGIDIVLADKAKFVELRINQFLSHFSKEHISNEEKKILRLLSSFSPLPFSVIASIFSENTEFINHISRLIDLSFVVVEDKLYRISDPIEAAALKAFGVPEKNVMRALINSILELISNLDFQEQRLDLHRILFRVSWLMKDKTLEGKVIFLFNDLIKTIKTLYDNERNYSKVIEATEVALNKCSCKSDYETVITYRVKSFIHQEKWQEATEEIGKLKEYADLRNIHYLNGFLNRKQNKIEIAIEKYLESQKCGRRDESLNRELGYCYFINGDYYKANVVVQEVLDKQRKQKRVSFYMLDLHAQIAIALGDGDLARSAIEQLETEDKVAYYHRKSTLENLLGNKYQAEEDAENALKHSGDNPRFHILSNLVSRKMTNGKIDEAEEILNKIDAKYNMIHRDIRIGLRTRLAIGSHRYDDAFHLSREIKDKLSKTYKDIRRDALQGYLNNCYMSDSERKKLGEELGNLKLELANLNQFEAVFETDSDFPID